MGNGGNWTAMRQKSITVSEWVTRVIKESNKTFVDDHFDIFKDYENPKGFPLLKYAFDVLLEAPSIASSRLHGEKTFNSFVYIPFGYSRKIKYWDSSNWTKIGENNKEMTYEPPSLCLLAKNESFFVNLNIEEYRCPIELPSDLRLHFEHEMRVSRFYRLF